MIEASVRQKGITNFFLTDNQFHADEGVQFAINVLKSNRTIDWLIWDNSVDSTENACHLVDAVLEHPNIRNLALTISLNEGITPYTPVKRLFDGVGIDKLRNVNIARNSIKTNGDRCIPDFLSTTPLWKRST